MASNSSNPKPNYGKPLEPAPVQMPAPSPVPHVTPTGILST
jgi:hypothetical protein